MLTSPSTPLQWLVPFAVQAPFAAAAAAGAVHRPLPLLGARAMRAGGAAAGRDTCCRGGCVRWPRPEADGRGCWKLGHDGAAACRRQPRTESGDAWLAPRHRPCSFCWRSAQRCSRRWLICCRAGRRQLRDPGLSLPPAAKPHAVRPSRCVCVEARLILLFGVVVSTDACAVSMRPAMQRASSHSAPCACGLLLVYLQRGYERPSSGLAIAPSWESS